MHVVEEEDGEDSEEDVRHNRETCYFMRQSNALALAHKHWVLLTALDDDDCLDLGQREAGPGSFLIPILGDW